jgi:hypothetical protein
MPTGSSTIFSIAAYARIYLVSACFYNEKLAFQNFGMPFMPPMRFIIFIMPLPFIFFITS